MPRVSPVQMNVGQRQIGGPTRVNSIVKGVSDNRTRSPMTPVQFTGFLFNWSLWLFVMLLMLSQLLTAIRSTTSSQTSIVLGQEVSRGMYSIPGSNDEPYTDRSVACVRRGKNFKAVSLNDALDSGSTIVEDSTGFAIHGYRVVRRSSLELSETSRQQWTQTCRLVHATLDGIFQACGDLGYANLTRDSLRVMDGNTLKNIPNALPILIMPFWDNGLTARSAIPAWDGHACLFRLQGQYEDPSSPLKHLVGVDKNVRESQTVAWLGRPGGQWRNGWYEDTQGIRWYTDVVAVDAENALGLYPRYFDQSTAKEMICRFGSECSITIIPFTWTAELASVLHLTTQTSIAISNGSRFGFFYYRGDGLNIVTCVYDFTALISNATVVLLLCRWMTAMLLLHHGYNKRVSWWHSAGIGSIAHATSFTYLPIAMLPRMKTILAAFFTVGCNFEGPQRALADAWFVMYPSIVDLVLIYASLLNMMAKILRRRMNDWVFPYMIVALSAMHYFRISISSNSHLHIGGRMSMKIASDEFERLTPFDMLSADVALRMGGNVPAVLWLKLLVLSLGVVSLLLSDSMTRQSKRSQAHESCGAEQALNIRACNIGGIGRSRSHELDPNGQKRAHMLNAYELVRLGYLILGDRYLVTIEDWLILSTTRKLKSIYSLWNHRIMTFQVSESREGLFQMSSRGQLMSIHDPALNSIKWWDIDARPLL